MNLIQNHRLSLWKLEWAVPAGGSEQGTRGNRTDEPIQTKTSSNALTHHIIWPLRYPKAAPGTRSRIAHRWFSQAGSALVLTGSTDAGWWQHSSAALDWCTASWSNKVAMGPLHWRIVCREVCWDIARNNSIWRRWKTLRILRCSVKIETLAWPLSSLSKT